MITFAILVWFVGFQQREYIPTGTVKVDSYWVDKDEVSNIHWLEYLHFKGFELDSASLAKLKPSQTNTWYEKKENRYKPITMITYQQAIEYCKWRSKVVSEKSNKKIIYRLMSPNEWNDIAKILLKENGEKFREKISKMQKKSSHKAYYLEAYDKESSWVSHFFTNVTEMTSTYRVAKGGSNESTLSLSKQLQDSIQYESPGKYLGFRCIAIVE